MLLVFTVIQYTRSQTYNGFPQVDGYWKNSMWANDCLDSLQVNPTCFVEQFFINGDTSINTELYKKVFHSGRDRNYNWTWTYWDHGYHGCYRNDLVNKKVYFIPKDSADELLLYDFDLNINDTIPSSYVYDTSSSPGAVVVDEIDSILINSTYLKRYHLTSTPGGIHLIEGIGSDLGLFSPIKSDYFEHGYGLMCFKNIAEELYYDGGDSSNCDLITDINNKYYINTSLSLYPNPSKNKITLQISNDDIRNIEAEIYDVHGKMFVSKKINSQTTDIDISSIAKGVYILKVYCGNDVAVKKLIKE